MWFLIAYLFGARVAHREQRPDGSYAPSQADILRAKWDARIPQQSDAERYERERVAKTLPWYLAIARFCLLPSAFIDWRRELPDVQRKVARHNLHAVALRAFTLASSAFMVGYLFPMLFHGTQPAHFIALITHTNPKDAASTAAVLVFVVGSFIGSLRWAPAWIFPGVSLGMMMAHERRLKTNRDVGYVPVIAHGREFLASYGAAIGLALSWPHTWVIAQEQTALQNTLLGVALGLAISYAIPSRMFPAAGSNRFAYLSSDEYVHVPRAPQVKCAPRDGVGLGVDGASHAADSADGARGTGPPPSVVARHDQVTEYDGDDDCELLGFDHVASNPVKSNVQTPAIDPSTRVPHYTYESAFPALGFSLPEEPRLLRRPDGRFEIDNSVPLRPPTD